jgi:hypothetical protein
MGEYAKRKSDDEEVKIGTCEEMYIRFEDRFKFRKVDGSVDPATVKNCHWRLPTPDEDNVKPGDYDKDNRVPLNGFYKQMDFSDGNWNPGFLQFTHDMGLLISVPCYHAQKLPDGGGEFRVSWNGHDSNAFMLTAVKDVGDEMWAIVGCKHCMSEWRFPMADVLPYVRDEELKRRLIAYNAKPEPVVQTPITPANPPADKQKPKRKGSMDWSEMFA